MAYSYLGIKQGKIIDACLNLTKHETGECKMEKMDAVEISEPGGPEVLKVIGREIPTPGAGQVLIEVAAAGINRPDCLQREGHYPPPEGASDIPGLEVSGTILQVGENVAESFIGKEVMALVTGGGYAQYVTAELECVLSIPKGMSMIEAAGVPETFFTVWHNVFQRGGLKKGETFLVHGGSSGIGTTAIQLAHHWGARTIVTVGSPEKCEFCIDLGADAAIDYRKENFVSRVRAFTDGKGADLILDMVGGSYVERNYHAAAMDGRIVQIAFLQGPSVKVNYMPLMLKRLTHTGSTLRARSAEFKGEIGRELEQMVWPMMEKGVVKPVIDRVFSMNEIVAAHQRIEESGHIGKIVLQMKE